MLLSISQSPHELPHILAESLSCTIEDILVLHSIYVHTSLRLKDEYLGPLATGWIQESQ